MDGEGTIYFDVAARAHIDRSSEEMNAIALDAEQMKAFMKCCLARLELD